MDSILTILVSVGSSILVGVASSYITFRLQFERHRAMDAEREKHAIRWRENVDAGVRAHGERLDGLERKNVTRDELDKSYTEMRMERLEMHRQNQEHLERIEGKIELERKEARDDRQSMGDRVTEIALRLASLGLDEHIAVGMRRRKK
jgi:hypothetical protein